MDGPTVPEDVGRSARFVESLNKFEPEVDRAILAEMVEAYLSRLNETIVVEETAPGFDVNTELRNVNGPFIEVAGPTHQGYELVDFNKVGRRPIVSNIKPGLLISDDMTGEPIAYWGKVDIQVDSQKLPFADNRVGAIFGSCLEPHTLSSTLEEANRVLEPGGFFVLQRMHSQEYGLVKAKSEFSEKYHRVAEDDRGIRVHSVVLQKSK